MTDYVISEEQLSAIELVLKFAGVTIKRNVLLSEIRSRPLSDELAKERENVLGDLKKDLKTRFIPSCNQWSKGRNSGLIECCNIIDESLRSGSRECPR